MRRAPLKALFALLTFSRGEDDPPLRWDRIVLIFSILVTIGLAVAYVHGKSTGRW